MVPDPAVACNFVEGRGKAGLMEWQVPLAIATLAFGAFVLWQVRPSFGARVIPTRQAVKDARAKVAAAKDDASRAAALCDVGDACAGQLGRASAAAAYYLRAMRCAPASLPIVERAAVGLRRRPRVLENLLWRRLGNDRWSPETRAATLGAVAELARLYHERLKNPPRARALEHLAQALDPTAGRADPGSAP